MKSLPVSRSSSSGPAGAAAAVGDALAEEMLGKGAAALVKAAEAHATPLSAPKR